ncbi:phage holin family protein [Microbacterium aurantiacum]|uniref:Phage holin family protein n=1 Tax=Microbacterium aurantiacum TaxID=162393 RepID=A0AAJ2M037_9MICO|nr:phage holin family protein [Microbacterium aurantiacum]MDS0245111.1 phage holin family protein [Microbacterium aurantiacum]
MTTPRGFRDRADDSIFTLVGEIPELVRNLVVAEIDAAKGWVKRTAKDAGIGAGWLVAALVVLFWSIPALGAFIVAGLSSWWPVWLSALVLFLAMLLLTGVLALFGILRFRRMAKAENPAEALAKDVEAIRDGL